MAGADEEFSNIRNMYHEKRLQQATLIAEALRKKEYRYVQCHKGSSEYGSRKRNPINPCYDLSNWIWVKAVKDGVKVLVTLQVLEQDPASKNVHALIDRIGIEAFPKDKKSLTDYVGCDYDFEPVAFKKIITRFQLPLSSDDKSEDQNKCLLEDLIAEVNKRVETVKLEMKNLSSSSES